MMRAPDNRRGEHLQRGLSIAVVALLGLLVGSCGSEQQAAPGAMAAPAAASAPGSAPAPAVLKPLRVNPEQGHVGTSITVAGEGLTPRKMVELLWATVEGSYDLKPSAETIEFYDRKFSPKRVPLGTATTDAEGRLSETFSVPEDYGETHDIVAMVDGQEVAKGGFSVVRNVTISPLQGPVGTPITIEVKGLGWTPFTNTLAVLYDNNYPGFMSAVTTAGSARAQIRAAGPPGKHVIRVANASAAVPYLNLQQSPVRQHPEFRFDFTITGDAGPPPLTLDWPDGSRVAASSSLQRTASSSIAVAPGIRASLSPASGPILSEATLQAAGLPPDAALDLLWISAKGNRISPSGWNLIQNPVGKAQVGEDGSLSTAVGVPDDLGGWHAVRLVQGEKVLAEVPYFVERSLVGVTPARVKSGETFTVQIKGVGWTELDNGVAVTYDNAYLGYACGFNSQGDVTLNLVAYGGPGTHLIDLYPMIFLGHGKGPWLYNLPQLTFAQDNPGLALGYRLPAYRLAVTVVD